MITPTSTNNPQNPANQEHGDLELTRTPRISDFIDPTAPEWDDDTVLLNLGQGAVFTQRHACAGVLILGQTGSGKTSAPGRALAINYLKAGYGMLVLCVKAEEYIDFMEHVRDAGRDPKDVIRITPNGPYKCDFLLYEMGQIGHSTLSLVTMLREATDILRQKGGGGSNDEFWSSSSNDLLKNAIDLYKLSHVYATELKKIGLYSGKHPIPAYRPCILSLLELIRTAPSERNQIGDLAAIDESFCLQCMVVAEDVVGTYAECIQNGQIAKVCGQDGDRVIKEWKLRIETYRLMMSYWRNEWASTGPGDRRMQDSIRAFAKSTIEALERGEVASIFQREEYVDENGNVNYRDTITPDALSDGKILIVDLPVADWQQSGKLAACIWKYMAQRHIERRGKSRNAKIEQCNARYRNEIEAAKRDIAKIGNPGLLNFLDRTKKKSAEEKLNRLIAEHKQTLWKIRKSVRPIGIYADECHNFHVPRDVEFQSTARSNRACTVDMTQNISSLDGAAGGGGAAHSLRDALAANLATKMFCKNQHADTNKWAENMIGHDIRSMTSTGTSYAKPWDIIGSVSFGKSTSYQPIVPAVDFTFLRSGGPLNNCCVDVIIVGAEPFAPRRTWLKCVFKQK
jgi:hypothetical protein